MSGCKREATGVNLPFSSLKVIEAYKKNVLEYLV